MEGRVMDIRDVDFFRHIAETGSLNKASQIEYSSATTAMRRLDALELELGAKLVTRTSHGVRVTPAGEAFCRTSGAIVTAYDELRTAVQQAEKEEQPKLRVALTPLIQYKTLERMWAALRELCPGYILQILRYGSSPEETMRMFEEFGIRHDILPCYEGTRGVPAKYRFRPLFSEELVLGVPVGHPFEKRIFLRPADLAGRSILMPDPRSNYVLSDLAAVMRLAIPHFTIEAADRPDPDMLNRAVSTRTPVLIPRSWEEIHPMIRAVSLELKGKQTPKIPFGYRFLETSACPRPLVVGRPDPAA